MDLELVYQTCVGVYSKLGFGLILVLPDLMIDTYSLLKGPQHWNQTRSSHFQSSSALRPVFLWHILQWIQPQKNS